MNEHRDEERELALLDEYLSLLQIGEAPPRKQFLEDHPELASAIECIEALEYMAPEPLAADSDPSGETLPLQSQLEAAPRDFGQYELLGEIGRGGMGVVYKARQKGLERFVAVKMILASHLASDEHVRRFQDEAKAAARMQHSNIVHIHDVGQEHGQHYFAMEYIEGESLAEPIAAGAIDTETAVQVTMAVARAVDHLHSQGIVHRDLKPSNILIDADGQPHVTDFGLAKFFGGDSQNTASGVITGTPSYMAPEQAGGRSRDIGPAADIYSLGAILYEMLTGRPPFREENPLDTLMEVLSCDPPLPRKLNPKVPRALELICLKCLAKSPEDRYESASDLAEELEHFARGEALQVRSPGPLQRLCGWTRRQPALALRLGALSVFYAIALVNYTFGVVDWTFHWRISLLVGTWAAASVVCQQFLESRRWSIPARFVWGTLDSLLFLSVLLVADGARSPLIVGYFLLIVGSGLWFRVRFVTFMTLLSLLSYGVLVTDSYFRRPALGTSIDRHVIFAVALIVVGASVAYLAQRVRTLSEFYGHKLP